MVVAKRQTDLELARDAIPGGLLQLEAFALAYPDHKGFRELHTESFCQYVVGFVFDDWEDAKLGGRDAEVERIATRLEPLLDRCVAINRARLPADWNISAMKREHVPAALWIASAKAARLALAPMQHVAELPDITAMLTRCSELAPGFHDAEAEILLGTLLAATSQFFGGDDGTTQFTRARTLAGEGALMVDVMFARGVAVARKDRAQFETTLERVIASDVARWPDRRLSNELALRKARRYLASATTLVP